jgi:hypothetical protein
MVTSPLYAFWVATAGVPQLGTVTVSVAATQVASGTTDASGTWGTSGTVASTAHGPSVAPSGRGVASTGVGTSRGPARSGGTAASPGFWLPPAATAPTSTGMPPSPPVLAAPPLPPAPGTASGVLAVMLSIASDCAEYSTAPSVKGRNWLASNEHPASATSHVRPHAARKSASSRDAVFTIRTPPSPRRR